MADFELSVKKEKLESFLPAIGAEATEEGYIQDMETGEIFESEDGEKLTIDEIGYLKSGDEQRIVPVRDNFPDLVDKLSDREFEE